ncbi:hypothetical protein HII13_004463 [Brettanomyces bruxellensis]|nr:hypothetical protein HII13_004463 [Brettanomyces bruxellensis]
MPHNDKRLSELVDPNTLLNVYGLRTLNPQTYKDDIVPQKVKIDTFKDPNSIPKDVIYSFLSDDSTQTTQNEKHGSEDRIRGTRDPLGFNTSVLDELIDKDIINDTRDPKSMKFMIGSKAFDSTLFLGQLHGDKSADELLRSIKHLDDDLESKKPLLQQLIADNFMKTLYTKNSMDKVFSEFSDNSLNKEVSALKSSLSASSSSSNQLLNPLVLQMSKKHELDQALNTIAELKDLIDLPSKLRRSIQEKDFHSLISDYKKGKKLYEARSPNDQFSEKIWSTVKTIIDDYKAGLWERLGRIHIEAIDLGFSTSTQSSGSDDFVTLISKILELGTDENPIIEFINIQFDYISKDMDEGLSKVQLTRLLKFRESVSEAYDENKKQNGRDNGENRKDDLSTVALKDVYAMLTASSVPEVDLESDIESYDLPMVLELWGFLSTYVDEITDHIVVNKILKFANIVYFFMNDFAQRFDSQQEDSFLQFRDYEKSKMRKFFELLIQKVCSRLLFLFGSSGQQMVEALKSSKFDDAGSMDKPKDRGLQSSYGFIPPRSNALSALLFLHQLQEKIFDTFQNLRNNIELLNSDSIGKVIDKTLKTINYNIIMGILCTMNFDIKRLLYVQDWTMSDTYEGCTKLPEFLLAYYSVALSRLRKLDVMNDPVVSKRIQMEFLRSFDILMDDQLKAVTTKTKDDSKLKDFRFITTLSNISALKQIVLPKVVQIFNDQFGTSLSAPKLKVYASFDNYEKIIYGEYLKGYRSTLKTIVCKGVRSTNWAQMDSQASRKDAIAVSDFILKAINFVNTIKSKLLGLKSNNRYVIRIELDLDDYIIKKLIDYLKEIRQFNSGGLNQICVDLTFLCRIFGIMKRSSMKDDTHVAKLESVCKRFMDKRGGDTKVIEQSVKSSIRENRAQVECFSQL